MLERILALILTATIWTGCNPKPSASEFCDSLTPEEKVTFVYRRVFEYGVNVHNRPNDCRSEYTDETDYWREKITVAASGLNPKPACEDVHELEVIMKRSTKFIRPVKKGLVFISHVNEDDPREDVYTTIDNIHEYDIHIWLHLIDRGMASCLKDEKCRQRPIRRYFEKPLNIVCEEYYKKEMTPTPKDTTEK